MYHHPSVVTQAYLEHECGFMEINLPPGYILMVYTKSHVGGSANAMADACEKAALHLGQRYDEYNTHMMDGLKKGRWMRTTRV